MIKKIFLTFFLLAFFLFSSQTFASENLYFLHHDHLGSTNMVTDEQGNVIYKQSYFPYGETRDQQSANNIQQPERQYTGQVSDQDSTELYYYNARYYSPQLALFTKADAKEGPNRYAYVFGNPINFLDPSGNADTPYDGGGGGSGSNSSSGLTLSPPEINNPIEISASETMGQTACYGTSGPGCGNDFPSSYYMDQEETVAWWGLGAVYFGSIPLIAAAPVIASEFGIQLIGLATQYPLIAKALVTLGIVGTAADVGTCVSNPNSEACFAVLNDPTIISNLEDLLRLGRSFKFRFNPGDSAKISEIFPELLPNSEGIVELDLLTLLDDPRMQNPEIQRNFLYYLGQELGTKYTQVNTAEQFLNIFPDNPEFVLNHKTLLERLRWQAISVRTFLELATKQGLNLQGVDYVLNRLGQFSYLFN